MSTTIAVSDLRQALRVILPFTDRTGMPVMESIHLQATGTTLTVTASDRYVLGHMRVLSVSGPLPATLLHYRQARLVRRALDAQPGNLTARLRRIRVGTGPELLEVLADDLTLRVPVQPGEYPDVVHLFTPKDDDPTGTAVPLNLNLQLTRPFSKAAKALGKGDARWTFHGPKSPARVEIGRTFTGLIMPRSFPRDYDPAPVPVGLPT